MKVTQAKPLNMKRAADIVQQFAGSGGEWWLSPASSLESTASYRHPLHADLIVTGLDGRELGRWPLLIISYESLVSRHAKNPAGEFALPHAQDYQYDTYDQLADLKRQAKELLEAMAPPMNAIQERIYFVDDTAGIDLEAAESWWSQAEEVTNQSWWSRLDELYSRVGSPTYKQHSSQLIEVLPKAEEGLKRLRTFLTTTPPPTPSDKPSANVTLGDGSRYQGRGFLNLNAGFGGSYFTSDFQQNRLQNRLNEWDNVAPFDREWPKENEAPSPTTLRQKLLEIQRLVGEVLQELE